MFSPGLGKDKTSTAQTGGVDNTRMGPYRALAQLSLQALAKGDTAMAAELARILEKTWEKGEMHGGAESLNAINSTLAGQIDEAMDDFIKPLKHYAKTPPQVDAVKVACDAFLAKLNQGDQ
jgi:hypothetical protein